MIDDSDLDNLLAVDDQAQLATKLARLENCGRQRVAHAFDNRGMIHNRFLNRSGVAPATLALLGLRYT